MHMCLTQNQGRHFKVKPELKRLRQQQYR